MASTEKASVKLTLKSKGAVEYVDLGELTGRPYLKGMQLGVRHEGQHVVRRWEVKLQQLRLQEAKRVRALIEEVGDDVVRELYAAQIAAVEDAREQRIAALEAEGKEVPPALREPTPTYKHVQTPEGHEAFTAFQVDAVRSVVASLDECEDPALVTEEIERLGVLAWVFVHVQEVQRPTAAQFPGAADPRDDELADGAAAVEGAGPAGGAGG